MDDSAVKAKIIATGVATIFSWVANRYWTFRNRRQANVMRELVLFLVMNGIGAGIQAGFVFIAKYLLGITSAGGMVLSGNVIGWLLPPCFRFIAYTGCGSLPKPWRPTRPPPATTSPHRCRPRVTSQRHTEGGDEPQDFPDTR